MSSSIFIHLSHSSQEGQSHLAFHRLGPRVNKYSVLRERTNAKFRPGLEPSQSFGPYLQ